MQSIPTTNQLTLGNIEAGFWTVGDLLLLTDSTFSYNDGLYQVDGIDVVANTLTISSTPVDGIYDSFARTAQNPAGHAYRVHVSHLYTTESGSVVSTFGKNATEINSNGTNLGGGGGGDPASLTEWKSGTSYLTGDLVVAQYQGKWRLFRAANGFTSGGVNFPGNQGINTNWIEVSPVIGDTGTVVNLSSDTINRDTATELKIENVEFTDSTIVIPPNGGVAGQF